MLGDRQPRRRRDEGDGGGKVDRPRSVAAGAAAVGEEIIGPLERRIGGAQRAGGADQLLGRLALDLQRDEQGGDGRLVEPAGDELAEQGLGLRGGEGLAVEQGGERRLGRGAWRVRRPEWRDWRSCT